MPGDMNPIAREVWIKRRGLQGDRLMSPFCADPRSGVYAYGYDSLNRLIRETDQEGGQVNLTRNGIDEVATYSDPRNLVTTYTRNGFGEVKRAASPDSGNTDTVRDLRGLATQTPAGTTHFLHDIFGNVIAESFFSALRMPTRIRAGAAGPRGPRERCANTSGCPKPKSRRPWEAARSSTGHWPS